jgi:hypothetical protein
MVEIGEQKQRDRWLLLLRRSLGLPDIMTERAARTAIKGRFVAAFDGDSPAESGWDVAEALLQAVLTLGARGELDDCLVSDPAVIKDLEEIGIGAQSLGERVVGQSGISGATTTRQRAVRAVDAVLGAVGSYVEDHPDI